MSSPAVLAATRGGDQQAFTELAARHERELLVHCYRMLGSVEDAEDMLQETLLRAWRGLAKFEGRSSLRSWLYRIATNVCLSAVARRDRRTMPSEKLPPGDPRAAFPPPVLEPVWLEPLPDTLVDERSTQTPEGRYDRHEGVTLAFLAALQRLPGRQRAALILHDILDWSAQETGRILETSVAAVNSALQRARATMRRHGGHPGDADNDSADPQAVASLLSRYVTAWEAADPDALVALLREDAFMTMPPLPFWLKGREAIRQFFITRLFAGEGRGRYRLLPTRANGCPAFGISTRDPAGLFLPSSLHVLVVRDGSPVDTPHGVGPAIAEMHSFLVQGPAVFTRFGLPVS
jgi:RNA polymerase sigma-70 factor, ECF subfamily